MSETFECGKCSKEITSGVLSDTMNPENSFPVVCLECAKEEDELVKFNNSEHAQTLNREPSPSPSEGARELARLIEREQGNCCGDVLNITAEDLEQIVQAYSAQQTQSLREELEKVREELYREIRESAVRYDQAVQPLQQRCSEYLQRAEQAESSLREKERELSDAMALVESLRDRILSKGAK